MKKGQHFNWSGQEVASPVSVLYCNIMQYNALRFALRFIGLRDGIKLANHSPLTIKEFNNNFRF